MAKKSTTPCNATDAPRHDEARCGGGDFVRARRVGLRAQAAYQRYLEPRRPGRQRFRRLD